MNAVSISSVAHGCCHLPRRRRTVTVGFGPDLLGERVKVMIPAAKAVKT